MNEDAAKDLAQKVFDTYQQLHFRSPSRAEPHFVALHTALAALPKPEAVLVPTEPVRGASEFATGLVLTRGHLFHIIIDLRDDETRTPPISIASQPLRPETTSVKMRTTGPGSTREWEFRFDEDDAIVIRGGTTPDPRGPDSAEVFARTLAGKLGWEEPSVESFFAFA